MSNKKGSQDIKRFAKQMASYATAAGLGAFGFSENADAAVNYTDISDTSLLSLPQLVVPLELDGYQFQDLNHRHQIDLDDNGTDDMSVLLSFRRSTPEDPNASYSPVGGDVSIKFNDFTLATPGTSKFLDKEGDTYYFLNGAFQLGDAIGVGGPNNVVAQDNAPYSDENQALLSFDYFGSYVAQQFGSGFVGFKWDMTGTGTNFHYGWVEIETTANAAPAGGYYSNATVKGFAYETTPNTPIVAGDTGGVGTTPGDFDGDGDVDGRDFLAWQRGESSSAFSGSDLEDWRDNYEVGGLTAAMNAVPEPTSLALLMLGAGAMAFNRSRKAK